MSWSQRKATRERAASEERELLLAQIQLLVQQAVGAIPQPPPLVLPPHLQYPPPIPPQVPQLWELENLVRNQLMHAMQPLAQALERQDQMREQRTADLLAQLRVVEGMLVDLLKDQPGPLTQMQQDLGLLDSMTRQ
jgi:hypothetical protein